MTLPPASPRPHGFSRRGGARAEVRQAVSRSGVRLDPRRSRRPPQPHHARGTGGTDVERPAALAVQALLNGGLHIKLATEPRPRREALGAPLGSLRRLRHLMPTARAAAAPVLASSGACHCTPPPSAQRGKRRRDPITPVGIPVQPVRRARLDGLRGRVGAHAARRGASALGPMSAAQRAGGRIASSAARSSAVGSQSAAAALARICSGRVAPAITVATAGRAARPPIATSSRLRPRSRA